MASPDLNIYDDALGRAMDGNSFVLAVVTATKPDFYKQAPIVTEAASRDIPSFIINTGQHYDDLLGHGIDEYGLRDYIGADLNVRGSLSAKTADMMQKVDKLTGTLNDRYNDTTVVPIVHGDTHAAGIFPQAWMFSTNQKVAHNEAGLRSMAPVKKTFNNFSDIEAFIEAQFTGSWRIDRSEPFPEQYNTFVGSAASQYLFPPTELNKDNLVREGYAEETGKRPNMKVVGNSVVDALEQKTAEELDESIFDIYPSLENHDDWIRVDIHRRANLLPGRFKAIIEGVANLVEDGYSVAFIEMNATRKALKEYGLREKLERLDENNDHFLFTPLWKKHAHVYEFLQSDRCFAALTDSGSMQEELNHIDGTLCLTARFSTDRPETVFQANTNILVPPISGEYMYSLIDHIYQTDSVQQRMHNGDELYGEDVASKIVSFLERQQDRDTFQWAHDGAGFHREVDRSFDYL